jgi:hypothetical protein
MTKMKIFTERSQILDSAKRWEEYNIANNGWASSRMSITRKHEILDELKATDLHIATSDEVNKITEYPYIQKKMCDECREKTWDVVEIGELPNYESATAMVCLNCLHEAIGLFKNV